MIVRFVQAFGFLYFCLGTELVLPSARASAFLREWFDRTEKFALKIFIFIKVR